MASSERSSPSQSSSLTNITTDEFEGLEVTDFDPNVLWELLYGPGEELESGEETMQCMDKGTANQDIEIAVESHWCLGEDDDAQNLNWLDVMEEEACGGCNIDMGVWCGGQCMEEVDVVYDYSLHPQSGILCEEIGYTGLWQDN